jgi:hypothetical protein
MGHKGAPTVDTSTRTVHGVLLDEAVDFHKRLVQEEYESQPKEKKKDRQVITMRQEGKNNHRTDC